MSKLKVYTITEAKAQLSDILRRVRAGERIAIGASRTPEVELKLYSPLKRPRTFGTLRGELSISHDFTLPDPEIERIFGGD